MMTLIVFLIVTYKYQLGNPLPAFWSFFFFLCVKLRRRKADFRLTSFVVDSVFVMSRFLISFAVASFNIFGLRCLRERGQKMSKKLKKKVMKLVYLYFSFDFVLQWGPYLILNDSFYSFIFFFQRRGITAEQRYFYLLVIFSSTSLAFPDSLFFFFL